MLYQAHEGFRELDVTEGVNIMSYSGHLVPFCYARRLHLDSISSSMSENETAPAGEAPPCPKCGGEMWDNRPGSVTRGPPTSSAKTSTCAGVIWPPGDSAAAPPPAPRHHTSRASGPHPRERRTIPHARFAAARCGTTVRASETRERRTSSVATSRGSWVARAALASSGHRETAIAASRRPAPPRVRRHRTPKHPPTTPRRRLKETIHR